MSFLDKLFGKKSQNNTTNITDKTNPKGSPQYNEADVKPKQPWECLPENFAVNDTVTARQFFMACEGSYDVMTEHFPRENT